MTDTIARYNLQKIIHNFLVICRQGISVFSKMLIAQCTFRFHFACARPPVRPRTADRRVTRVQYRAKKYKYEIVNLLAKLSLRSLRQP